MQLVELVQKFRKYDSTIAAWCEKLFQKLATLEFLFIILRINHQLFVYNETFCKLLKEGSCLIPKWFYGKTKPTFGNLFFPRWAGEHINHMRRANDLSFQGHVVRSKLKKVLWKYFCHVNDDDPFPSIFFTKLISWGKLSLARKLRNRLKPKPFLLFDKDHIKNHRKSFSSNIIPVCVWEMPCWW